MEGASAPFVVLGGILYKPHLTKFAYGRWWVYVDTRRKWKLRSFRVAGKWFVISSHRKVRS
jgi:hypothetical protein